MANDAQRDYWNTTAGPRWVENQEAMDRSLQEISRVLLDHAAPRPGERVIDVGCGTGATTLAIAERVGPRGSVLGIDISEPMLALAHHRAAGRDNLRLQLADAQTHGFEPGAADLACSRFGVMFFEAPPVAFANLRRGLRAGGRLCFVCWGPLKANPWFAVPLKLAVDRLGPVEPPPPRAPGPLALSEPDYVTAILRTAGFTDIVIAEAHPMLLGRASAAEEAELATRMGPLTRLLEAKRPAPESLAALVEDLTRALAQFETPDGLRFPTTVFCVSAVAP